jgi:hypothetical protein
MIHAQYALIAEHYREGLQGKFDLLGPFDRIFAAAVPAQHSQLWFIAMVVTDDEPDLGLKQT